MYISNKKAYESKDVVSYYFSQEDLYKPEDTILNIFKNRFKVMRMLDIGVGAGRTTVHFAKLAKEYIGIDYSENMINACKKRFHRLNGNISFKVCDARDMRNDWFYYSCNV